MGMAGRQVIKIGRSHAVDMDQIRLKIPFESDYLFSNRHHVVDSGRCYRILKS